MTLKNKRKTSSLSSDAELSKEDPQDIPKLKIIEAVTSFNPFLQNFLREIRTLPLHIFIF